MAIEFYTYKVDDPELADALVSYWRLTWRVVATKHKLAPALWEIRGQHPLWREHNDSFTAGWKAKESSL